LNIKRGPLEPYTCLLTYPLPFYLSTTLLPHHPTAPPPHRITTYHHHDCSAATLPLLQECQVVLIYTPRAALLLLSFPHHLSLVHHHTRSLSFLAPLIVCLSLRPSFGVPSPRGFLWPSAFLSGLFLPAGYFLCAPLFSPVGGLIKRTHY